MRDSKDLRFDHEKVEALPDVQDQLTRMEAAIEELKSMVGEFAGLAPVIGKWARFMMFLGFVIAVSCAAVAVALITLAVAVING